MKKYIYMVLLGALICACTKNVEIIDPYSPGSCIGKIELGAAAGTMSVSVETSGDWRVETADEWLTIDTKGRTGNGAFTVYYESNESDVMNLRSGRVGKVAIRHAESKKIHTLVFVQQGFYPVAADAEVVVESVNDTLIVPISAVTQIKGISYAYVKDNSQKGDEYFHERTSFPLERVDSAPIVP